MDLQVHICSTYYFIVFTITNNLNLLTFCWIYRWSMWKSGLCKRQVCRNWRISGTWIQMWMWSWLDTNATWPSCFSSMHSSQLWVSLFLQLYIELLKSLYNIIYLVRLCLTSKFISQNTYFFHKLTKHLTFLVSQKFGQTNNIK